MVEKISVQAEEDLLVDLTFHGFSAALLKEFAVKIVQPYFKGNLNEAVKSLLEKVVAAESFVNEALGR
jgi:hypothetical protein